ncbi:AMP-binding protein [Polynucleobacter brandtiae]|uniref:Long-chain acyl-CoA synthetase n=1 Tax=Polynucleobacter brandtiae TaxID=1938816 RepID=A0A2M8VZ33_9BURK|nr:AMP-binding protein [Polynucleobacter brandtiae]PJI83113.1 long-chain acyl-CoA synthetase [Polynucleobacter brandtiae]
MTIACHSLGEVLLHWEKIQGSKTFLFAPETKVTLSYAQLAKEARCFSTWLDQSRISEHGHVGLFMQNGRQTSTIFIAAMSCGRVITPLNLLAPIDQLAWVLDHSDIELLFYSPDKKTSLFAALEKTKRQFVVVELDPDAPVGPFMDCQEGVLPNVRSSQPALLMYTSGTTGTPKGVLLTHANLLHAARSMAAWHSLTQADTVLSSLPIYHINGQVISTITPFVSGGAVVAPHSFSASNWWNLAIEYRCTWINMVPTIIAYLINAAKSGGKIPSREDLQHIRFGRSASAPLPPEHHHEFENLFGITVIEGMGMTESASMVFCNPHDESRRYGSPGLPCGVEAKVIDPSGMMLENNTVGEICLRGGNVLDAYYKAEAETAKAFDSEGWLKTGDLGLRDEQGFYFITGRLKELIIKGGENIAPREIDEVILKHPAVLDVAAVGIPDKNYGQEIMACIILKPDMNCSEEEMRTFCLQELGKFRTPKTILFMDELPRGPSGKVQRLKLLDLVLQNT